MSDSRVHVHARKDAAVDLAELQLLFAGDDEGLAEVLREVASAIQRGRVALQDAYEIKDWNELTERAHELKGVCGNVGAKHAASRFATLERTLSEGSPDPAGTLADALRAAEAVARALIDPAS